MKIFQHHWTLENGWIPALPKNPNEAAQLGLIFSGSSRVRDSDIWNQMTRAFPRAFPFGCSTAGEIVGTQVTDESVVLTAVQFERARVQGASIKIGPGPDSFEIGKSLAEKLSHEGLVHAFVLSNGLKVNGSELVKGLVAVLPKNVTVTGGLSGDGPRFQETLVAAGGPFENDLVGIVGFYGEALRVGYGSQGGWDSFGPERMITRSKGNVLYELDHKSALELYKKYLGEHAAGLPSMGLLFPLSVRTGEESGVVRTILSVDEKEESLTFAGDVPQGSMARLMKANFDRLIDGAAGAAKNSCGPMAASSPDLAILISCVGRKLILKQRVEEEVEGVRDILGAKPVLTGFYSYGEISPFTPGAKCELHNQTMTITTFRETE